VSTQVSSWLNFTPLSLNPQLWLDAADPTTITLSGSSVTQWDDKSGNGYNVTQGTAISRPTIATDPVTGLTVIDFDGSNDQLIRTTATALGRAVTGLTMYAVHKPDVLTSPGAGGRQVARIDVSGSGLARASVGVASVANKFYAQGRTLDADSLIRINGSNKTTGSWYSHIGVFDYANTSLFLYVNNILDASTTSFQTATTTSNTNSNNLKIGAQTTSTELYDGQIAEVFVFHSAHDTNTRNTMISYLHSKWGV